MTCAWQVEINEYAGRVLKKHWPDVPLYRDVREVGGHNLEPVDLVCGGFPCQPHSLAGARKAENDERDLWDEFARVIRELRPRWVLAENVPGLLSSRLAGRRGGFFGKVLADLAALGYDAEWDCVPASALGAHHERDRVFLVAYPHDIERGAPGAEYAQGRAAALPGTAGEHSASLADAEHGGRQGRYAQGQGAAPAVSCHPPVADPDGLRELQPEGCQQDQRGWTGDRRESLPVADAESIGRGTGRAGRPAGKGAGLRHGTLQPLPNAQGIGCGAGGLPIGTSPQLTGTGGHRQDVSDADGCGCRAGQSALRPGQPDAAGGCQAVANPDRQSLAVGPRVFRDVGTQLQAIERGCRTGGGIWAAEPAVGRVAHGVPARVDRLRGLGNAVVPHEALLIGSLILAAERGRP
ncbi:DNA cytosine methyltransferase [Deinococcus actinosclerus]|uniref:DNA cytosine methyltransferase n=1 Tax=Deinococcus actinosclerus TaxID=1768108 RepID=UPI003AAC192A